LTLPTLKNSEFLKPNMAAAAVMKVEKSLYIRNGLTNQCEILHGDAYWRIDAYVPYRQLEIRSFKNPRWRTAAVVTIKKS